MDPDNLNEQLIEYESLLPIDKFLLNQLNTVLHQVTTNYDEMNINKSILLIENFFITQLSSLYINSVRDRLYCERQDSLERRSAQTALFHVLSKSLVMLGPIMPHLSEEAFHYSILKKMNATDDYSLFRSDLNFQPDSKWANKPISNFFTILNQLRGVFFEIVQSDKMSIFQIKIKCSQDLYDLLKPHTESAWLTECFGCAKLSLELTRGVKHMEHNRNFEIDGVEYSFILEAEKSTESFACMRCRRFTSANENEICNRCSNVIKASE